MTRTWVYVMIATHELDCWEDQNIGRQRQWFSLEQARELLTKYRPVSGMPFTSSPSSH